jgi:5-(carboxyamino)imidazole ribonucleotide synthase
MGLGKIAILGGGQLGLMLLQAAADLHLECAVMDPDGEAPARAFTAEFVQGDLKDTEAVLAFVRGARAELVTVEIEHVSVEALYQLQREGIRVYPQPEVLELIGDKTAQKKFYLEHGIPTAPFWEVGGKADVLALLENKTVQLPLYQKAGRGGYDGRGVVALTTADDVERALDIAGYLEEAAVAATELCVIVARNVAGKARAYPAVESMYYRQANMVDYLLTPSHLPGEILEQAAELALRVAEAFNCIGLLAVEMFYTAQGQLWVNECAPRPHNTGHHTIEACATSQYSQHLRAITGLPLGETHLREHAATVNLVGAEGHSGPAVYEGLAACMEHAGVYVHLYGKKETRPFRKMGHVTLLGSSAQEVAERIAMVKQTLRVVSKRGAA